MSVDKELLEDLKEVYNKNAAVGPVNKDTLANLFKDVGEPLPAFRIRDICDGARKSNNEEISFDEFISIFKKANLGKTKGVGYKQNVQAKAGITAVSGYEQTSSGTVHSVSEAEKTSFSNYINSSLSKDPDCAKYLPINPDSEDLFSALANGIILCKLINFAVPNTIDVRTINTAKINAFTSAENLVLAINSASAIGCHVVNIDSEDIKQGRVHLTLGLLWQIIRISVFNCINITKNPDLLCLLLEGETPEQLFALSPEELLMRWVNYQLKKVNCTRSLTNYSSDLKDSEIYAALEQAIMPDKMLNSQAKINSTSDIGKRAEMVLDNSKNAEVVSLVSKIDILNGVAKLNMVYIADMFNKYPCLTKVQTEEIIIDETREEKTYRNWMNSLGVQPFVYYLYSDLSDGLVLLQLCEILSPNCLVGLHLNKPPFKVNQAYLKKTENCNKVVDIAKKLNLSTVGLSGQDIAECSKMHVLGLVWQLMSRYTLKILQDLSKSAKPITEPEIIAWVNEKIATAGQSIKISSFKDANVVNSFAILEIINAIKPDSVNRSLITEGVTDDDKLLNAKLAISLARKIGSKVYALPEDVVEAKVKMIMTIFACLMITSYHKN